MSEVFSRPSLYSQQMIPSLSDYSTSASIETLQKRAQAIAQIRIFFDQRGFFEVETPLLSRDTVVDRYLEPFQVTLRREPELKCQESATRYLQTSPEFLMKRILASGGKRIYQITKAFRDEEVGDHHNPEFTMLEWYEADADYQQGMTRLAEFCEVFFSQKPATKISYADAFERFAGVNPFTISDDELFIRLQKQFKDCGLPFELMDRDDRLNWLLTESVQPNLGIATPQILYDWPATQAALAKTRLTPEGHIVAERFELYVHGAELANGYHELLDANELLARNVKNNELRKRDGKKCLPVESLLLKAMHDGLPPCYGVALGVDRLLMLILAKPTIRDVMAFHFASA